MKIEYIVSTDNIIEFSDILSDNNLSNQITGTDEDNLLIDVNISKDDRDIIDELSDLSENED